MWIETLVVGALETNCYLLSKEKGAKEILVIDPGAEPEKILKAIGERTVVAVLLTHGHFDHTGALSHLKDSPIYLHKADVPMLKDSRLSAGYLLDDHQERPDATHHYQEGDVLDLAGIRLTVLETPGHTMGSVCLLGDKVIFTGDTLFQGSYGRTDLAGGSEEKMRASLRRLFALEDLRAYPGHGPTTSL